MRNTYALCLMAFSVLPHFPFISPVKWKGCESIHNTVIHVLGISIFQYSDATSKKVPYFKILNHILSLRSYSIISLLELTFLERFEAFPERR